MGLKFCFTTIALASIVVLCSCSEADDRGGGYRSAPDEAETCDATAFKPDIPLRYRIRSDESGPADVMIDTEGGEVVMKFTPWGPHAEPHTGHAGRDIKTNWLGYLAPSRAELEELDGDANGICDPWETCGLPVATVLARRPRYVAPDDGLVVTSVILSRVHEPGFYYGTLDHWAVETHLCVYQYAFGHVGWIGEDLRAAMIEAGAPDPMEYKGPTGVNLLSKPIVLSKGASIAIPQVVGQSSERHPGMVVGDVWVQMEVPTHHRGKRRAESVYSWLDPSVREDLQAILWREMLDPAARNYTKGHATYDWLWKAESALFWSDHASNSDYSSILSDQGSWFENHVDGRSCRDGDPFCDQAISIWPITKTGPVYDPSLYDSPATSYLILKSHRGGSYFRGEVVWPEVLGLSGTMLIKWRLEGYQFPIERYQKLSYSLDPGAEVLKLSWGVEDEDRAAIENGGDPVDPASLDCDGSTITCMDHKWHYEASFLPGY